LADSSTKAHKFRPYSFQPPTTSTLPPLDFRRSSFDKVGSVDIDVLPSAVRSSWTRAPLPPRMLKNVSRIARPLFPKSHPSTQARKRVPEDFSRRVGVFWDSGKSPLYVCSCFCLLLGGLRRKAKEVLLSSSSLFPSSLPLPPPLLFLSFAENTGNFSGIDSLIFLAELKRRVNLPINFIRMYQGELTGVLSLAFPFISSI